MDKLDPIWHLFNQPVHGSYHYVDRRKIKKLLRKKYMVECGLYGTQKAFMFSKSKRKPKTFKSYRIFVLKDITQYNAFYVLRKTHWHVQKYLHRSNDFIYVDEHPNNKIYMWFETKHDYMKWKLKNV